MKETDQLRNLLESLNEGPRHQERRREERNSDPDRAGQLEAEYEALQDGINELQQIQDEFINLRERLTDAIRGYAPKKLAYWRSYGLAHLAVIIGSDEYMSRDESISSLIEMLEEEMEDLRDEM